jgi:hypothetical protein
MADEGPLDFEQLALRAIVQELNRLNNTVKWMTALTFWNLGLLFLIAWHAYH